MYPICIAFVAVLCAPNAAAAPPHCRVEVTWHLAAPPADPVLATAVHALSLGALDPLSLAVAGVSVESMVAPTPNGADLQIVFHGPQSTLPTLEHHARHIARTLPATIDHTADLRTPSPAPETPASTAARAAMYMLNKPSASDLDPSIAAPRLAILLRSTPPVITSACDPQPRALISSPMTSPPFTPSNPTTLPPLLTASALTPPRLVLLAPSSLPPTHAIVAISLLTHPGASLNRALVAAPIRATAISGHHFAQVGLFALVLDLPHHADSRASLHEARRTLANIAIEAAEVRGAAYIAGISPDEAPTIARNLSKTLGTDGGSWVFVAPPEPMAPPPSWIDDNARTRFVAASIELRCPAPDDLRKPEERLHSKLGLDATGWRNLAREVATDRDVASALEREIVDRCEELKRLRRVVDIAAWRTIRQTWACRIRVIRDPEKRWHEEVRLMLSLGFDSSMLTPILGMDAGDPTLEKLGAEIDARCPWPVNASTGAP